MSWLIHHYVGVRLFGSESWQPFKLNRTGIVLCTPIDEAAERVHNQRTEALAVAIEQSGLLEGLT